MNKRTAKRIRQNNHRLYHESVVLRQQRIKFKEAVKAPPINIEMLTKENRNDNKT
jgi:DNA-binding transcriptional MerR regulator